MKTVIDKLISEGRSRGCSTFKLDIRRKPGLDTAAMQTELDGYMASQINRNAGETGGIVIQDYEFIAPQ